MPDNDNKEISNERIIKRDIEVTLKSSYLDYAMSVIVGRALPEVRDGLKPVHRRVLFAMHEMNLRHNRRHLKSARVVGDVIGKYHPHGDSAVYDTLVRMAQDFSLRYMLVEGQGNFGSIDGDSPAAMRYTEVRMRKIADALLADLDYNTVNFKPNYDESMDEPEVLPTVIPNLLVNGSSGIAVGMATNIPPHNLNEVIDAILFVINNPNYTYEELFELLPGPDFPTRGFILGRSEIYKAYRTGKGSIKMRGKADIEIMKNGREQIIVTELPYQVNKANLIEKIAELVQTKVILGIADLRDESDKDGIRIAIDIKKGENTDVILNQLYKHTQLQTSFGINSVAIVKGKPRLLNLGDMLEEFIAHRITVVKRRTEFFLKKARERLHILEGLKIAVENIDEIVELIKSSQDVATAKKRLIERFSLSLLQSQAILDMRLSKLTGLEIDKLIAEYNKLLEDIKYYLSILNDREILLGIVQGELKEAKETYGDERRTVIIDAVDNIEDEDLINDDPMVVTMSHQGYVKRMSEDSFTVQKRGGKGKFSNSNKTEDFIVDLISTSNKSNLFILTNLGMVHFLKVYKFPEMSREARGRHIMNLLKLNAGESVVSILSMPKDIEDISVTIVTKQGVIKRTLFSAYSSGRSGIRAVTLREGDEIVNCVVSNSDTNVFIGTKEGKSIQFRASDIRTTGRTSAGVRGIRIGDNDEVVSLDAVEGSETMLTITENGYGKRSKIDNYRLQNRGGKGVKLSKVTEKTGLVVGAAVVHENDSIMLISESGKLIRLNSKDVSLINRDTQGVKLMDTGGDKIVTFAIIKDAIVKDDDNS